MPSLLGRLYRTRGAKYCVLDLGDVLLLTEATLSAMKIRSSGVYARCEAELRGITKPVRLYSTDTALDERSTLRRKSLITDA